MKSTKDRIVEHLLKFPRSSINNLADAIGINAISVRHHLTNLQSEGIIEAEEERHGVGRPRLVYYLTEKGMETFPTCYLRLTNLLIEELKHIITDQQMQDLFEKIAIKLSQEHVARAVGLPLIERMPIMTELLVEQGFLVDWEKKGNAIFIREMTCPFQQISQFHPEICKIDTILISSVLGVPEDKIVRLEDENSYGTYRVYESDAS